RARRRGRRSCETARCPYRRRAARARRASGSPSSALHRPVSCAFLRLPLTMSVSLVRGTEAARKLARLLAEALGVERHRRERRELAAVTPRGALGPRIDLRVLLRLEEPLGERAPPGVVVDDAPLHMREPDALDPRRGALEIARLLAIELQERRRMLEHLVLGR